MKSLMTHLSTGFGSMHVDASRRTLQTNQALINIARFMLHLTHKILLPHYHSTFPIITFEQMKQNTFEVQDWVLRLTHCMTSARI
jgi:hypothetical protein